MPSLPNIPMHDAVTDKNIVITPTSMLSNQTLYFPVKPGILITDVDVNETLAIFSVISVTDAPTLSTYTLQYSEGSSVNVTITNYSHDITYTVESQNEDVISGFVYNGVLTVVFHPVTSTTDTSLFISAKMSSKTVSTVTTVAVRNLQLMETLDDYVIWQNGLDADLSPTDGEIAVYQYYQEDTDTDWVTHRSQLMLNPVNILVTDTDTLLTLAEPLTAGDNALVTVDGVKVMVKIGSVVVNGNGQYDIVKTETSPVIAGVVTEYFALPILKAKTATNYLTIDPAVYISVEPDKAVFGMSPKVGTFNRRLTSTATDVTVYGDVTGTTVYVDDITQDNGWEAIDGSLGTVTYIDPNINCSNSLYCKGQYFNNYHYENQNQPSTVTDLVWGDIGNLPANLYGGTTFTTNNHAFIVGGSAGSEVPVNTIYSAPIDTNGIIGDFTLYGTIPIAMYAGRIAIIKNNVYIMGGANGSTALAAILKATILSDGTISSFEIYGNMPIAIAKTQLLITNSHLYVIGGDQTVNGILQAVNSIMRATIDPVTGDLGSWSTNSNALPAALGYSRMFVSGNNVFLVGGAMSNYTTVNSVYKATIDANGLLSSWTLYAILPFNKVIASIVQTKNRVYLIGGNTNGTTITNSVYYFDIDTDNNPVAPGSVITLTQISDLPVLLTNSALFVTKSGIYLAGGMVNTSGNTGVSNIYLAPFADGWETIEHMYNGLIEATVLPYTAHVIDGGTQLIKQAYIASEVEMSMTVDYNKVATAYSFRVIQEKMVAVQAENRIKRLRTILTKVV